MVSLFYVAPVNLTLNPPSPKEIFNNLAKVDCIITGQDKATVDEVEITWEINGQSVSDKSDQPTKMEKGQHSKTSTITRNLTEWKDVSSVSCSAIKNGATILSQDLMVHKGGMAHTHADIF